MAFKLALGAIGVPGRSAVAFDVPESGSCVFHPGTVYWYFSDEGVDWTPALRSEVRTGIAEWNKLRKEGGIGTNVMGAPVMPFVELSAPASGAFKIVRLDGSGGGGTNCDINRIRIDPGDGQYRYVGAHEISHAFGLRHTGQKDQLTSLSGVVEEGTQLPLVAHCGRSTGIDYWKGRSDELSSAWYKASTPVSAVADGGFESVLGMVPAFATTGSPSLDGAYSYAGDRSMLLAPSSSIRQRVRLTNQLYASVSADVRYKTNSGASTAFKLAARTVSYNAPYEESCDPGPHKANFPTPNAWTWTNSSAFATASTWSPKPLALTGALPNPDALSGIDVDVTISNGGTGNLWIDNLRVQNA